MVFSTFKLLYFDRLVLQIYKSLSIVATIMILTKCPIIAEQLVVIFMMSLVTIATVYHYCSSN